jgi:GNAT superfamily N-acetyltransferase
MADATVRPAEPADAAEIARIQLDIWRTAYAELLPEQVLAGLDAGEAALTWRQTIEQGPAQVFVAVEGDWLVGLCAAGPAPEDETAGADGAPAKDSATVALVSTLLVEARWGRRGHGARLLAEAGRAMLAAGSTRGIAWIPERDAASLAFYQRAAWVADGTVRTLDADGRPLREIRVTGTLRIELDRPTSRIGNA